MSDSNLPNTILLRGLMLVVFGILFLSFSMDSMFGVLGAGLLLPTIAACHLHYHDEHPMTWSASIVSVMAMTAGYAAVFACMVLLASILGWMEYVRGLFGYAGWIIALFGAIVLAWSVLIRDLRFRFRQGH